MGGRFLRYLNYYGWCCNIHGGRPLSRTMECTASGVNPDVICGLQLIIVYRSWFISCNKCATLMQHAMIGETRRRVERNSLYFPHNFSENLNLLRKMKSMNRSLWHEFFSRRTWKFEMLMVGLAEMGALQGRGDCFMENHAFRCAPDPCPLAGGAGYHH